MSKRDRSDFTNGDKTGDIISWVVIFILLFAFFPLGLFFLFLKLRGALGPSRGSRTSSRSENSESSEKDSRYRDAVSVKYTPVETKTSESQASGYHTSEAWSTRPAQNVSKNQIPNSQASAEQASEHQTTTHIPWSQTPPQTSESQTAGASYEKSGKARHPLKKKTGRFISAVMLVISIAMAIVGFIGFANVLQQFFGQMTTNWFLIAMSVFFFMGGATTFLSRNVVARRYSRFKNYYGFIGERGVVPLAELAQISGVSVKAANRDLQMMINNGYLIDGAYIDNELECLVLCRNEAQKLKTEIKGGFVVDVASPISEVPKSESYDDALVELREINSYIADEEISKKVSHLTEVTTKIFKIASETPEKKNQLKRFMSYYLPTTIKLVRSYITLEKQGIRGENIIGAKENIGNILDTLSTGFEQQLDMLFKADALDIAADISVLENLMQQDGLMSGGSAFQVMKQ